MGKSSFLATLLMASACVTGAAIPQTSQSQAPRGVPAPEFKQPTMAEWEAAHGIHRSISYASDGTVTFAYGSSETRTMSLDEFEVFVRSRFSDFTIVAGRAPYLRIPVQLKPTDSWVVDVAYYSADGRIAFVRDMWMTPEIGTWSVEQATAEEMRKGFAPVVLCWKVNAMRDPFAENVFNGCTDAYDALLKISDKRSGDVFDLMAGKTREGRRLDNAYLQGMHPKPWPDGQPLIAERAPHD